MIFVMSILLFLKVKEFTNVKGFKVKKALTGGMGELVVFV